MSASTRRRAGFTLLEVLLASLIAVFLLAALYFAMDMTLRQAQVSRDGVEADNLTRSVFNRMTIDLSSSLGPLPPKSGGNAANNMGTSTSSTTSGTGTSTGGTTTSGTTGATTDPNATTTDPNATTTEETDTTVLLAASQLFQAGVIGSDRQLTVYVARLPDALSSPTGLLAGSDPSIPTPSDLRRVTYWLSQTGGLCRQEKPWVTADGVADSTAPDLTNEAGDVVVDEAVDVQFEYFDPTSGWTTSWDGSVPGPDGVTPTGPPRAVRVTLTLELPSSRPNQPPIQKTVVQVIPVRAAPGAYTPPLAEPNTTGTDTGTGTSGATGGGQ
jgi:prepilin-type N-terminal cleavage/methylation domain-containing protein